jgi:uncharacterized protein YjdB
MTFMHKLSRRLAMIKDRVVLAAAATCALAVGFACELPVRTTDPNGATLAQLIVAPKTVTLQENQPTTFMAVGLTTAGDTVWGSIGVIWSVTGGSILDSTSSNGRHYGHYQAMAAPGQVEVVATAQPGGLSDTATVTVIPAPVASVSVSPSPASMSVGQTLQLTATTRDANGTPLSGRVVTWTTSDATVAPVSGSGLVTGRAAGSATITATSEGKSGTSGVTIASVPVASVAVTPSPASVQVGSTVQLTATPQDANGTPLTGRVVTWTSSDTMIAPVSGSGLVTGRAPGSATITATSEGTSGTSALTVLGVPVASVTVTPSPTTVPVGQTVQLTATPKDANGAPLTGRLVIWTSSDTTIAKVSGSGLVTGRAAGSATVSATSEGKTGTSTVSVAIVPVASVTVTPSPATVPVGQTAQLTATPKDANGAPLAGRVVTWTSSDTTIARVSGSGLVTGRAAGLATVSATSEGKTGTSNVSVTFVPVASVTVSPALATVAQGSTLQLTATPRDANGTPLPGRVVTWTTSDTTIAKVSSTGLVTGRAVGGVTITATSEGKIGTAIVTVVVSSGLVTDPWVVFTVPVAAKPAYLSTMVPSPFGTKVTRIAGDPGTSLSWPTGTGTWGSDARHHYSKDQPWSSDGSLIALMNRNGGSPSDLYLDGNTYQPARGPCTNYSISDDRWHPSPAHPHERIAVSGSELMWFDVTTCTKTRSWTLPISVDGIGSYEGNASNDGRYVALGNADGSGIFVVDMATSRIGPVYNALANCHMSGCVYDWVQISASGKYVVVQYTASPDTGQAAQVFDVDATTLALTMHPTAQIYPHCGGATTYGHIYNLGHSDLTVNPFDGNDDVLIGKEHCGNTGKTVAGRLVGGVVMVRLRDGLMTPLTDPTNEAEVRHVSTRNLDRPGWAYVGYVPTPGTRFADEIVAVRLDGTQTVERLVHKHTNDGGCYRCEAHSVPSRDGKRVLWASNWMSSGTGGAASAIEAYIVDTRP